LNGGGVLEGSRTDCDEVLGGITSTLGIAVDASPLRPAAEPGRDSGCVGVLLGSGVGGGDGRGAVKGLCCAVLAETGFCVTLTAFSKRISWVYVLNPWPMFAKSVDIQL
jgi:hypothetical protein